MRISPWADGQTALVAPALENALADEKRQVSVYTPERAIPFPHQDARAMVDDLLAQRPASRVGVDRTSTESPAILNISGKDASSMVLKLRRRKEADEVEEIRASLRFCKTAYDAAREVLQPGETEIGVYLSDECSDRSGARPAVSSRAILPAGNGRFVAEDHPQTVFLPKATCSSRSVSGSCAVFWRYMPDILYRRTDKDTGRFLEVGLRRPRAR